MTNPTRKMLDDLADNGLVIFRGYVGFYVLRDREARKDLAHEPTLKDIFKVARAELARRTA